MTLEMNESAIREDPQHAELLEEVATAIVSIANNYTSVDIQPARSEVRQTDDGPEVIIGAKAAAAVSVEFGTRYRKASAPIRRAGLSLGLDVPR